MTRSLHVSVRGNAAVVDELGSDVVSFAMHFPCEVNDSVSQQPGLTGARKRFKARG